LDSLNKTQLGQILVDESNLIEVFYQDSKVSDIVVSESGWIEEFLKNCAKFDLPITLDWQLESNDTLSDFVAKNVSDWNLPENYLDFDLRGYLLSKCNSSEGRARVEFELQEFEKRNMMLLLRWIKYFVDTMRANNQVWGVGRGSSCASYCLFLMDLHRIDALKYKLDIGEFLK
jgi:DNA polymerase III alpha subunit